MRQLNTSSGRSRRATPCHALECSKVSPLFALGRSRLGLLCLPGQLHHFAEPPCIEPIHDACAHTVEVDHTQRQLSTPWHVQGLVGGHPEH